MDKKDACPIAYKSLGYESIFKTSCRLRIAARAYGVGLGGNQLEDVVHEGLLTLLGAVDRFDPDKGVKLETYVTKRLRGMMIDLSRK